MSLFEHRAARNEALFREVNEERQGREEDPSSEVSRAFICECSRADCVAVISVTDAEYERVRSNARWFLVAPGHETLAVEHVVASHDSYSVVEKDTTDAAAVADRTDPRA